MTRSATLSGRPFLLSSARYGRGGVLPWTGPLAQRVYWYGLPSLLPPQKVLVNLFISCWLVLNSALEVTKLYDISMLMGFPLKKKMNVDGITLD